MYTTLTGLACIALKPGISAWAQAVQSVGVHAQLQNASPWTSKRAQNNGPISKNREYKQYRVHYFGHFGGPGPYPLQGSVACVSTRPRKKGWRSPVAATPTPTHEGPLVIGTGWGGTSAWHLVPVPILVEWGGVRKNRYRESLSESHVALTISWPSFNDSIRLLDFGHGALQHMRAIS